MSTPVPAPVARPALCRAVAQGCASGWPKPVLPPPPLSPRPLLSKARGEPQFSLPSGRAVERSRLARHVAAPAAVPDWLALASSRKAHAASSPTPGGKGAAAAPWARGTVREELPGPALTVFSLCALGSGLEPPPPPYTHTLVHPSHMLRMPAPAPLEFQGFQSSSRAPAGSEEATRDRAVFRTTPSTLEKMAKGEVGGAKRKGERSNSQGESSTPALGEAGRKSGTRGMNGSSRALYLYPSSSHHL